MLIEPENAWFQVRIIALRSRLNARAAGLWRVEDGNLRQLAFDAAPDMPGEVAHGFAQATMTVPLVSTSLGIVIAVLERRRAVSIAADMPAKVGSGYWLHGFEAARSVAVPIVDDSRTVVAVVAVALPTMEPTADEVETALRREATVWFSGD